MRTFPYWNRYKISKRFLYTQKTVLYWYVLECTRSVMLVRFSFWAFPKKSGNVEKVSFFKAARGQTFGRTTNISSFIQQAQQSRKIIWNSWLLDRKLATPRNARNRQILRVFSSNALLSYWAFFLFIICSSRYPVYYVVLLQEFFIFLHYCINLMCEVGRKSNRSTKVVHAMQAIKQSLQIIFFSFYT